MNCEPCILFHIRDAFVHGAVKEEILETIEIGYELGGGPSIIKSSFAFKVLDYYREFGKLYYIVRKLQTEFSQFFCPFYSDKQLFQCPVYSVYNG